MSLPLAVIILSAPTNDIDDIAPLLPSVLSSVGHLIPCTIVRIPEPD